MEFLWVIIILLFLAVLIVEYNKLNTIKNKQELDLTKQYNEKTSLEKEILKEKENLQSLKEEYNDYQDILSKSILTTQKTIDEAAEQRLKTLNEQYEQQRQQQQQEYDSFQEELEYKKDVLQKELCSLQSTRAAIEQAYRREEEIKNNIDFYRLNISKNDEHDIQCLRSIRHNLSKPRVLDMLIWQSFFQPLAKEKIPLILGDKKITGIYKITNIKNQKSYIGQAKDVKERWLSHFKKGLGIDSPQGNKLYQAILEDGLENFTFELLEECGEQELNAKEKFYIDMYNSCDFGYNSNKGIKNG